MLSRKLIAQLDRILNAFAVGCRDLAGRPPCLFPQLSVRIVRQNVDQFGTRELPVANRVPHCVFLLSDLFHDRSESGVVGDSGEDGLIEKQLSTHLQDRIGKVGVIQVAEKILIRDNGANLFLKRP